MPVKNRSAAAFGTRLTEQHIVRAIRDVLDVRGVWHWKHCPGPFGGQAGVADIIGCYQGRMVAIEVKKPGGRATEAQVRFLRNVEQAGGIAILAYSVDDVIAGMGWSDLVTTTTGGTWHELVG